LKIPKSEHDGLPERYPNERGKTSQRCCEIGKLLPFRAVLTPCDYLEGQWMCRATVMLYLIGCFAIRPLRAEDTAAPTSYRVAVSLGEGNPAGSLKQGTIKILASPVVMVKHDEAAEIFTGTDIQVGDEHVQAGTGLKVTVKRVEGGELRVQGVFELSTAGNTAPGAVVKESTSIHFSQTLKPQQSVRIPLSSAPADVWSVVSAPRQRWLEITVAKQPSVSPVSE
jgi:hypothetical protein